MIPFTPTSHAETVALPLILTVALERTVPPERYAAPETCIETPLEVSVTLHVEPPLTVILAPDEVAEIALT